MRKEADGRPLDSSHSGHTGLRPAGRGVGGRLLSISHTTAATAPPGLLLARLLHTWQTPHASCPPEPGGGALLEAGLLSSLNHQNNTSALLLIDTPEVRATIGTYKDTRSDQPTRTEQHAHAPSRGGRDEAAVPVPRPSGGGRGLRPVAVRTCEALSECVRGFLAFPGAGPSARGRC
ncbi:unnamed protein product [Gadus morhua 'NCC']